MLSAVVSAATRSATNYFYLPVDDDTDTDDERCAPSSPKRISWTPFRSPIPSCTASASIPTEPVLPPDRHEKERLNVVRQVLAEDDLYCILGIPRSSNPDKLTLRKAYFARCKECHPDKFPNNPEATHAFQKVSVAYDVLSKPSSRRIYDSHPSSSSYDIFASRPSDHADQTFTGCVTAVFNDFIDGDLEIVRSLLRTIHDLNPHMRLGDEAIDSVLASLEAVRQRALTCRTCVFALHSELARLLEIQHTFRQLSYFDLRRRSHLTLQFARLTLSIPFAVERAILQQAALEEHPGGTGDAVRRGIVPHRVSAMIKAIIVALERMEGVLK